MKELLSTWLPALRGHSRFFAWLAALVCVLCLVDFMLRVYVGRDAESRKFTAPAMPAMPSDEAGTTIRSRLVAALPEVRPPEAEAEVKPREIALQGVFAVRGLRTAALVLLPQGDKLTERRNVKTGEEIDGWLVEQIAARRVTLRKGSEVRELVMLRGKVE